jgi:cytochrome c oxidase cbb3-type subunit 2
MNRGPYIFLGAFAVLALSWVGAVLANQLGYGALTPYYDALESTSFPAPMAGIARRGEIVYKDLGCAACHTQQVRRADVASDIARGWGERPSMARDYIQNHFVQLGSNHIGPDLRNYGARATDASALLNMLYQPAESFRMPGYSFLFETRKIVGQSSPDALSVPVASGYEVVPTERAHSLVAYLISLHDTYAYPEVNFVPPTEEHDAENAEEGGH